SRGWARSHAGSKTLRLLDDPISAGSSIEAVMTVAGLALVLAAPAPSAASTGFCVPHRPDRRPPGVCFTKFPHRVGPYFESPFIKPHTYDQLGVLRLTADGTVTKIRGGNDLLLAIEGDLDHTQPRSSSVPVKAGA